MFTVWGKKWEDIAKPRAINLRSKHVKFSIKEWSGKNLDFVLFRQTGIFLFIKGYIMLLKGEVIDS